MQYNYVIYRFKYKPFILLFLYKHGVNFSICVFSYRIYLIGIIKNLG